VLPTRLSRPDRVAASTDDEIKMWVKGTRRFCRPRLDARA